MFTGYLMFTWPVDMQVPLYLQDISYLPGLWICRCRYIYRVSHVYLVCGYAGAAMFTGCLVLAHVNCTGPHTL